MTTPDSRGPIPAPRYVAHNWATVTYPLLVIRLFPATYHLRPLAQDLSRDLLIAFAWAAMKASPRQYQMCLVFSPHEALYLFPGGKAIESRDPPSGGFNPAYYPPELDFLPGPVAVEPGSVAERPRSRPESKPGRRSPGRRKAQ